jgi:TorA maturation chaperone TorD
LAAAQTAPAVTRAESITAEDQLRAHWYRLLARFLSCAPTDADLATGSALAGNDTDLGRAITTFARVCSRTNPAAVAEEYHDLFIGLVRGELVPYGSYYLTGFLHEKPLAKLRTDMQRLGIVREEGVHEPEDHIASVCEMMAGFIDGQLGSPLSLEQQKAFFETHINSWAPVFFRDLETAQASVLYSALGSVGRAFLAIEEGAFAMV